ncbi:hypothetical protein LPJ61_000916 [Coemansia biformis]|uniref:Carboxypeptidase n=1 Tax=Coemansia biformis TaxID=1286918 RepID=A0A9W7YH15_9FUNG|nr:hypothetical protein LPJ61_000916 [Coemansia biformis]
MELPDHYAVLGIASSAAHEEIKQAYHALSRKIHPDKQSAPDAASASNRPGASGVEFYQLSVAWEVLGDRARRRAYDRQLSARHSRARGVVQDEVDLDDMAFDPHMGVYTFPCRCSGSHSISEDDLDQGRDIAPCKDCSLKIRVLYDVVDDGDGDGSGSDEAHGHQADRVVGLPYRPGDQPVHESYAGHITVRTWTPPGAAPGSGQAKLFYWYFPAIAPKVGDPPLLLWIQGGPGSSSMIGLFTEMGPLELTDDGEFFRRNVTWANEYDLLVVDQPAGTGFSSVTPQANLTLDDLYPLARQLPDNVQQAWRAAYPGSTSQYTQIRSPMTAEFVAAQARDAARSLEMPAENWPARTQPFLGKLAASLSARGSKLGRQPGMRSFLVPRRRPDQRLVEEGRAPMDALVIADIDEAADPFLVNAGYGPARPARTVWEKTGLSSDEAGDFVDGYATNMRAVGKDMWAFLQAFFGQRPQLRTRDFYLLSESYGGKYVPGIAAYIGQQNDKLAAGARSDSDALIRLRGVLIGNSLVHPALQVLAHGGIGFAWGLLDADQADTVDLLAFKAASHALDGELEMANEVRLMLFDFYRNATGGINWYDIRQRNHQYKRLYLDRGLNQPAVRRALHSEDIPYGKDWGVYFHLTRDIMRTTAPLFPYLLERGLRVELVQGQFDFRDGVAGNTLWINGVQWAGRQQFAEADRQQWWLGKDIAGFVRAGGNLTHCVILNAGHMAPGDQPEACQDMVDRFVGA